MLAEFLQYREDLPACPLHVIVDNHVSSNLLASRHLSGGTGETRRDVFVAVASTTKTLFELLHRGGDDEKDDGFASALHDLFGALHLNFEQHLRALGGARTGRPVQIAVELRPLKERVVLDRALEGLAIDEVILTTVFRCSYWSCRPALAEPQCVVACD